MTPPLLPIARANAEYDIIGTLPLIVRGDLDFNRITIFCGNYRRRGICSLFLDGVPILLHRDLQKSGGAFLSYLKGARPADVITSKAAPFFDAIACKDLGTARMIAERLPRNWNREEEYEDDFLYVFFLMKSFFLDGTEQENGDIVDRYGKLLEGASEVRLDLCQALLRKDNIAFEEAVHSLILQQADILRQRLNRGEIIDEEWAVEGQFFVEGLALIRLAELRGFTTERNYRFIPSLAIESAALNLDPESWKDPYG